MLDGRVLEASQVEYKPFGKPPLQREAGLPSLGESCCPSRHVASCSQRCDSGAAFRCGADEAWSSHRRADPGPLAWTSPLSLEGVFQMAYILPERLLALVRPAFDLVLRRIRSLKRCVQACGCKIETPRYACNLAPGCISSEPTFAGLRKTKKKENKGSQKKGSPKKKGKGVSFGKA